MAVDTLKPSHFQGINLCITVFCALILRAFLSSSVCWMLCLFFAFIGWLSVVTMRSGMHSQLAAVLAMITFLLFAEMRGLYRSWRTSPLVD